MNKLFKNLLSVAVGILMSKNVLAENASNQASIYDLKVNSIRGKSVDLADFKGKVILVVNTASKCGFTSQYEELEALYNRYKDRGFFVFGFPSNDFGKQEPGSAEEIENFCKINYGVTFPLFEKAKVTGNDKQDIYKVLTEKSEKTLQGDPGWNFVKFLVDKKGFPRSRFSSIVSPDSSDITKEIEKLLSESD